MLYFAIAVCVSVGVLAAVSLLVRGKAHVPVNEPAEWQANPNRVLSATLDSAFTRF